MQNNAYSGSYLSAQYPQQLPLNTQSPLIPNYCNNYAAHLTAPSLVHYEQYTFFHPPSHTNSSTGNVFPFTNFNSRKRFNVGYTDLSEESENELIKRQKMSSMYPHGHGFYSMDNMATVSDAYSNPHLLFKGRFLIFF